MVESDAKTEAILTVDKEGHEQTGQFDQTANSSAFLAPRSS